MLAVIAAHLTVAASVVAAPPARTHIDMHGSTRSAAGAAAGTTTVFTMAGGQDFITSGGASITANPKLCVRSGTPNTKTVAALAKALSPGATVDSLAFSYRYQFGFAKSGPGANFTLTVDGKTVYTSPPITDYPYGKSAPYSPAVKVRSTAGCPSRVPLSLLSLLLPLQCY